MGKRRGNGEGTVYQRKDGRWTGQVTVGRDSKTGKLKRKSFYGRTRTEVVGKMDQVKGSIRAGLYTEPTKITVGEWLDKWLYDYMKASLRPTTWESYEGIIRVHVKPEIGFIKLTQLQTNHLQAFLNRKLENGRADGSGALAPRTVRYIHTVIHGALEQACHPSERLLPVNPAKGVKLPKDQRKEPHAYDTEAVKAFLKKAAGHRHFPAYLLELATGLRRGELLALSWKEIDWENGTVTINRNLVRTKEKGLVFQKPKTSNGHRTIPVPARVLQELKNHRKRIAQERLVFGPDYQENNLVFPTLKGTPYDPRTFTEHFEGIVRKLKEKGHSHLTFHGLRHSFATLALQEGIPIKVIQEILGHHSPAFTMAIYTHTTEKMKQEATDKVGHLLASCIGPTAL